MAIGYAPAAPAGYLPYSSQAPARPQPGKLLLGSHSPPPSSHATHNISLQYPPPLTHLTGDLVLPDGNEDLWNMFAESPSLKLSELLAGLPRLNSLPSVGMPGDGEGGPGAGGGGAGGVGGGNAPFIKREEADS